jgi:hypothetical protein
MAKAFFNYLTEGTTFAYLVETATATALGLTAATVGTPRLPHKLKPGKIAIKLGTGHYKHVTADESIQATFNMGDSLLGGVIVGFDGEVNNAFSAF